MIPEGIRKRRDMAMRAVIFDFGGVLARGMGRHLDSWERRLGLTPGMLPATIWGSEISERAARGHASQEEVWATLGATFGLDAVALAALQRDFFADEMLDEQLISFIRRLRPHYKTAVLSNAWPGTRATFEDTHRLHTVMDELIISAEEGLAKPDPRLYRLAAGRLGIHPRECVFIDDSVPNVRGAEAVGMHGVLFTDTASAIAAIQTALAAEG